MDDRRYSDLLNRGQSPRDDELHDLSKRLEAESIQRQSEIMCKLFMVDSKVKSVIISVRQASLERIIENYDPVRRLRDAAERNLARKL